jgi:hypothetical protein
LPATWRQAALLTTLALFRILQSLFAGNGPKQNARQYIRGGRFRFSSGHREASELISGCAWSVTFSRPA